MSPTLRVVPRSGSDPRRAWPQVAADAGAAGGAGGSAAERAWDVRRVTRLLLFEEDLRDVRVSKNNDVAERGFIVVHVITVI